MQNIFQTTGGTQECKHVYGEISMVTIKRAGKEALKVRVANLAPEVKDTVVCTALAKYVGQYN
jgi:hypothetical protein